MWAAFTGPSPVSHDHHDLTECQSGHGQRSLKRCEGPAIWRPSHRPVLLCTPRNSNQIFARIPIARCCCVGGAVGVGRYACQHDWQTSLCLPCHAAERVAQLEAELQAERGRHGITAVSQQATGMDSGGRHLRRQRVPSRGQALQHPAGRRWQHHPCWRVLTKPLHAALHGAAGEVEAGVVCSHKWQSAGRFRRGSTGCSPCSHKRERGLGNTKGQH